MRDENKRADIDKSTKEESSQDNNPGSGSPSYGQRIENHAEMTIEQAFSRLDQITKALEDPETSLEDSFALYKEGSELLREAGLKIDKVEKQVRVLQPGQGAGMEQTRILDDSLWVE